MSSPEDVSFTVIEKTETGYRFRRGVRQVEITDAEALKLWIAFGLLLDRKLEGSLSKATAGGLDALRRAFLKAQALKTGD